MAVTKGTTATKKDTTAPVKKAPAEAKAEPKKATTKVEVKPVEKKAAAPKAEAKPAEKKAAAVKVITPKPAKAEEKSKGYTVYHVSKRENDGREWKVFIQGSTKVIKLFDTQKEALDYAKSLCKNKDDGSYVVLHGLDGKIRKY